MNRRGRSGTRHFFDRNFGNGGRKVHGWKLGFARHSEKVKKKKKREKRRRHSIHTRRRLVIRIGRDDARDASSDAPIFFFARSLHGGGRSGNGDGSDRTLRDKCKPDRTSTVSKIPVASRGGKRRKKKRATRPGIFPFARMRDHHHAIATTAAAVSGCCRCLSPLPSPSPSLYHCCRQCEKCQMTRTTIDGRSTKANERNE